MFLNSISSRAVCASICAIADKDNCIWLWGSLCSAKIRLSSSIGLLLLIMPHKLLQCVNLRQYSNLLCDMQVFKNRRDRAVGNFDRCLLIEGCV